MKYIPVYVPYTLARFKKAVPANLYFILLFAVTTRAVKPSFIRAIAGLLNTHPLPKITVRQMLAAMALERSAKGDTSSLQAFLNAWIEERPYAPGPSARDSLEK